MDSSKFRCLGRPRRPVVVSIGSFAPFKRIDFVIDALACIALSERPELVWIGNTTWGSSYLAQMIRRAKEVGVVFTPLLAVSDQEVVRRLNEASLMVCAPRLEPFGYAPLEANACGLPVVAVAEGGVRETVVDGLNGLVTDPDPQAVADAVAYLLHNPCLARNLGKQGMRLVAEKWSLKAATDRLECALLRVAGKGNAARTLPDPLE